jgi:hypothetical protein
MLHETLFYFQVVQFNGKDDKNFLFSDYKIEKWIKFGNNIQ